MIPELSIITGTKDRPEGFARLLRSVHDHTKALSWEMIVTDAGETAVACEDDRVRLIRERPPLGPSRGYNTAFAEAKGEFLVWLNDDVEVLPGWATNAIEFLKAHPQVGIAALYFQDGYFPDHKFGVQQYQGMVFSNFGLLRRDLGEKVGWFDPGVYFYGNDNSICFRVLKEGLGVVGVPSARIIHHRSRGRERDAEGGRRQLADHEYLCKVYGPSLPQMRATYARTSAPLQGPMLVR